MVWGATCYRSLCVPNNGYKLSPKAAHVTDKIASPMKYLKRCVFAYSRKVEFAS